MSSYEFPFEEFDGISEEMHDFLRKCLAKDVNERWGVSDLMEHPFVKDSVERMKSEVLARSVKMLKSQEVFDGVLEKWRQSAYVVLFHQDNVNWYYQGIVEKSSSLLIQWSVEKVIEVDTASHKLLIVNGEEVNGIEHNQVLDLSDDGERWEGDVLNNQPYGWGVLYDSDGEKKYEGFRIGEVNVCYGTRYYSDIQKPEYEGEWFEGNRWGRGIEYDRKGNTVYEG
ncbi:hypothetical protein WA577_001179, partial [Blastocystis sp. JDR]